MADYSKPVKRRDFLRYGLALAGTVAAAYLGYEFLYKPKIPTPYSNSTTTTSISSSTSSTTSAKTYDLTLRLFHDLHADGKQQSDEPIINDTSITMYDPMKSTSSVYKPDTNGVIKITDLVEGADYSLSPTDSSSLFRYITPSNSNFVSFSDFRLDIDPDTTPEGSDWTNYNGFKLRISPDNLDINLPLSVGPATWPFASSRREVVNNGPMHGGYMDISILYGGPTRDWMGGDDTYKNHPGDDILSSLGAPILSIMPGTVDEVVSDWTENQGDPFNPNASADYRNGNYVSVEHPYGFRSLHTHLKDVYVKVGDFVPRGKLVGTVGATGRATAEEPEDNLMLFNLSSSAPYNLVDLYRARGIAGAVSYWTKDSNPQQPEDPQCPNT